MARAGRWVVAVFLGGLLFVGCFGAVVNTHSNDLPPARPPPIPHAELLKDYQSQVALLQFTVSGDQDLVSDAQSDVATDLNACSAGDKASHGPCSTLMADFTYLLGFKLVLSEDQQHLDRAQKRLLTTEERASAWR